ncbi:MAG: hypothetical protein PHS48_02040 [Bacteroidales bacterium]|nr:hypothetical protein [Bacteroidales bacterium]
MLKDQFIWYLENQSELVKKYNGKFLVIKDKSSAGVYDNQDIALIEAEKNFGLGNFIIQKCSPGESSYSQTFHSRVAFV